MLKQRPVEIVSRDCPFCDKTHNVEYHVELVKMPVKGDNEVEFVAEYFLCPDTDPEDGNSWTPGGMLDDNLSRGREAYRIKHGLLTSSEIVAIRNMYGFNQKELADLLGWGAVTISRYETKHIQDETYDRALRMVKDNPSFVLEELTKRKDDYNADRFFQLKELVEDMILEDNNVSLKRQELKNRYVKFNYECDANGYKVLDIDKVADVVAYFANFVGETLYKVKLMKMLWYNDLIYFFKHGFSMTGLVYAHALRGALPIGHNEIIYLSTVDVIEEEQENSTSYKIVPLENPVHPVFTLEEQEILNMVAQRFKDDTGNKMSRLMHKEDAYKNTAPSEVIMYSSVGELTL
jgi:putative zinc finger/helix-turn-helix YgiT family protein